MSAKTSPRRAATQRRKQLASILRHPRIDIRTADLDLMDRLAGHGWR